MPVFHVLAALIIRSAFVKNPTPGGASKSLGAMVSLPSGAAYSRARALPMIRGEGGADGELCQHVHDAALRPRNEEFSLDEVERIGV